MKRALLFLLLATSSFAQAPRPPVDKFSLLRDVVGWPANGQWNFTGISNGQTMCWSVADNKMIPCSGSGGGAPADAHYVTTQAESGLSAEFSLGTLTSGILKQSVSGSVATISIATPDVDYLTNNQIITISGEVNGAGATSIVTTQTHFATFDVDGVGIVLSTGTKNPWKTKYAGTLVAWSAMCVPSTGSTCSVSFDLLRAVNAAGLPTASMVGAGTKPSISSDVENSGTTFPSWTSTTINVGDNLAISLSGITTAKYAVITFWWK